MQYIDMTRAVRAIERTARQYGYGGDATLDDRDVPTCGTLGEQLAMVCVGLDSGVRLSQMSSRDAAWTRQRLRSAVLGSTPEAPQSPPPPPQRSQPRRRAW